LPLVYDGNVTSPFASRDFVHQLLSKAVAANASDVHLKVGQPPGVRVDGSIRFFKTERLGPADTAAAARVVLGRRGTPEFLEELLEHDTSYAVQGLGRFRVNVYRQRGSFSVALRIIPMKVPALEELDLPFAIADMAKHDRGLVLVVGPTGNGKSTTLAALIDKINDAHAKHIITIEDPIEFLHLDKRACVSQREVGIDTASFARALRAALRQDPDVILVGEIRDAETLEIAVQASETGHLVMSTMHTPDVGRTVNRMLSLTDNPEDLRDRIGDALQGIVAQRLVQRAGGGMIVAAEILVATGTVREAIKRPDKNPTMKELLERGVQPYGMQTFQMALRDLVKAGKVTKEVAKNAIGF
jgi:twitching motility protein PilT